MSRTFFLDYYNSLDPLEQEKSKCIGLYPFCEVPEQCTDFETHFVAAKYVQFCEWYSDFIELNPRRIALSTRKCNLNTECCEITRSYCICMHNGIPEVQVNEIVTTSEFACDPQDQEPFCPPNSQSSSCVEFCPQEQ